MQFTPGGGHDGFDIAKTMSGSSSGRLTAGRYFAVALHNVGGSWVCPAEVNEQHPSAGAISNLCVAAQEGGCNVKLIASLAPGVGQILPHAPPQSRGALGSGRHL